MALIDVEDLLEQVEPTEATGEQLSALRDQLVQSVDVCRRLFESEETRASVTEFLKRIDEDCESIASKAEQNRLTRIRLRRRRAILSLAATGAAVAVAVGLVEFADRPAKTVPLPSREQLATPADDTAGGDAQARIVDASNDEYRVSKGPVSSDGASTDRSAAASTAGPGPEPGPWDELLESRPIPFEDAWSRMIPHDTSVLTLKQLQEWFEPVAGHPNLFLTGQHGPRELPGFEGLVKLSAPFAPDATLRLSVPEHQNLRIYLYRGDEGLMIQHNDADDRAYKRMRNLEGQLAQAQTTVGEARENHKQKNDAAQGPLKAIQVAVNNVAKMKAELEKTEKRKPAAVEASRKANDAWRKATTEKNRAFREAPRIAARARSAAQKARNALTAARRKPADKGLKRAVDAANQLAKKEADASRVASRAKTDASRAWSVANSRHLAADREMRKVDQDIRRWQQQLRNAERRVTQQEGRAKRVIAERDVAQRSVEAAVSTVERIENDLALAKREAAGEAANRPDDPNAWAIWSTRRATGDILPTCRILRGTDEGRTHSTALRRNSQFELRYVEGNVVLTRGDIVLLTAPISGLPDEVYVSGSVLLDNIAMLRTHGSVAPYELQTDLVKETAAGSLRWTSESGPVTAPTDSDGSVEANADTPQPLTFPRGDSHLIVLNVCASAGAGITLHSALGEQLGSLQYYHDQPSGDLAIRWGTRDDSGRQYSNVPTSQLTRSVSVRHFVRLLFGCQNVKAWVSPDLASWVPVGRPLTGPTDAVSRIGLCCVEERGSAPISLSDVQYHWLRQMKRISGDIAVPSEITPTGVDLTSWRRDLLDLQPEDISTGDWMRACAVGALTAGCEVDVAESLFDFLLDESLALETATNDLYSLLHECSLLVDLWTDEPRLQRMVDRFKRVAEYSASRHSENLAYSDLRRALMSMPLWTQHQIPISSLALARRELLRSVYSEQWHAVGQFCRETRYFELLRDEPLIEWANGLAVESEPELAWGQQQPFPKKWWHPLNHRFDKEQYNQVSDFDAAVSALALDDAMQITEVMESSSAESLVRSQSDPRLYVSLRTAIESARVNVPEFRDRMDQDLLPAALLRLRQSIRDCDANGVELAAIRYPATRVAEEAHAWLGDLALSSGRFQLALNHYRRAQEAAGPLSNEEHTARIALTVAMLGGKSELPGSAPVRINGRAVDDFRSLLVEMQNREAGRQTRFLEQDTGRAQTSRSAFVPVDFTLIKRGQIDVPTLPEAARSFALGSDNDHVFLNTGDRIHALDRQSGERNWTSGVKGTCDYRSPVTVSLRPLVTDDSVFARLHDAAGPMLVCLDQKSGEPVWSHQSSENKVYVSDPMLSNGSLYMLVATKPDEEDATLRLAQVDPSDGRFVEDHVLVQLRDSWWQHKTCRVSPQSHSFVAGLGGVIIHAEYTGRVRWIRTQTVVPADVDPTRPSEYFDPPLIEDGRVYMVQPGVPVVDCVEMTGGTLLWRVVLPTAHRLFGISNGSLVATTDEDIRSLNCQDGSVEWAHNCIQLVDWVSCDKEGNVVYCHRQDLPGSSGLQVPELVWLNPQTGRVIHRRSIDLAKDPQPVVSQLFAVEDMVWGFIGQSRDTSRLDLFEFGKADLPK